MCPVIRFTKTQAIVDLTGTPYDRWGTPDAHGKKTVRVDHTPKKGWSTSAPGCPSFEVRGAAGVSLKVVGFASGGLAFDIVHGGTNVRVIQK